MHFATKRDGSKKQKKAACQLSLALGNRRKKGEARKIAKRRRGKCLINPQHLHEGLQGQRKRRDMRYSCVAVAPCHPIDMVFEQQAEIKGCIGRHLI